MGSLNSPEYIADLKTLYAKYLEAEITILTKGQEYTIEDRTLRRADLKFIRDERKRIASDLAIAESGGKIRVKRVLMRDDE